MTHLHKKSKQTFEVGQYVDGNETYDITVISYWKDADTQGVGLPVELIGYYFGEYTPEDTDYYIDRWITNRERELRVLKAAQHYMDAYLTTNEDVLEKSEVSHLQESLDECQGLLYDRSWRLEDGLPPAFLMNRTEYVGFLEQLLDGGEINQSGFDVLRELAINFPEQ